MEEILAIGLEYLLQLAGIVGVGLLLAFKPRLAKFFDSLASKDEMGVIESIANMGVELAERELTGKLGEEKFEQASRYVSTMLGRYGIEATPEFIQGAVQSGWRRMDTAQNKNEATKSDEPVEFHID